MLRIPSRLAAQLLSLSSVHHSVNTQHNSDLFSFRKTRLSSVTEALFKNQQQKIKKTTSMACH